jgi:hypothetical protein
MRRWLAGKTLFLPGNLTHKVLTLEPYLGIGSFHIGLPNSLDTFTRWLYHGPLWSMSDPRQENAGLVDEAAKVTLGIMKRAQSGSTELKEHWGFLYLHRAYVTWEKSVRSDMRRRVLEHPTFRKIVEIAKTAGGEQPANSFII